MRSRLTKQVVSALFLTLLAAVTCTNSKAATFMPLFDPSDSADYLQVQDISGDGLVVVGDARNGNESRAFRWQAESNTYDYLGDLTGNPNGDGYAHAVSDDGSVITGRAASSSGTLVFLWDERNGMRSPLNLNGFDIYPTDISADGTTIVGRSKPSSTVTKAFVWREQEGTTFIDSIDRSVGPGDFMSSAEAVSADGLVVAGNMRVSVNGVSALEGFRWSATDGLDGIGDLPPVSANFDNEYASQVHALSDNGSVIVGKSTQSHPYTDAVTWTLDDGIMSLRSEPYFEVPFSSATAVSGNGTVVAGEYDQSGLDRRVFLWTSEHGMQDLSALLELGGADLQGWRLDEVAAMSNDGGVIVGYGYDTEGNFGSWYANLALVPEPSGAAAMMILLQGFAVTRRFGRFGSVD